jgi:hypothetical protein
VLLPGYNVTNSSEAWPKARATAERELALDSTLAAARTTLAYGTFMFDSDWRAAEQGASGAKRGRGHAGLAR